MSYVLYALWCIAALVVIGLCCAALWAAAQVLIVIGLLVAEVFF